LAVLRDFGLDQRMERPGHDKGCLRLVRGGFARWARIAAALLGLTGCARADFAYTPDAAAQVAAVQDSFYFEYCAGSDIRMNPGFPPDISGGAGGHAAFFLNGACRDPAVAYPTLRLCDELPPDTVQGAGVSMDANFSNANWTVTPGHDFFYNGGVPPGEPLTAERYRLVQHTAEQIGVLRGIVFQPALFADKPAGMSDEDYRYNLSIGTEYGLTLARGLYCARVPLSRAQMAAMVDYLNAKNALYRNGPRHFDGSVFQDNCVHLSHNTLAVAAVWKDWPTDQFWPFAVLSFPVPKNDFVNQMRRTNDTPMADLAALYDDPAARRLLLDFGRLPSEPGALATAYPPHKPNAVFRSDVALMFYDDPPIGSYQRWFDAIFSQPRYTDPAANLRYFSTLYASLEANRLPLAAWDARLPPAEQPAFAVFYARYYQRLAALRGQIAAELAGDGGAAVGKTS
jgi:hypothetical protein